MMIGGFSHSAGGNGRETAQNFLKPAWGLAWGEFPANNLPVGETAIPVASAKHLFRTPSLGGQARGSTTHLLAIFLWCAVGIPRARRIAQRVTAQRFLLRDAHSVSCIFPSGIKTKEGWAECSIQNYGWPWRLLAVSPHVATRWVNKPLSVAQLVQAQQQFLTATWRQARQLVRQVTCFTASSTQASANAQRLVFSGAYPGSDTTETSRTAREAPLARGFLRGSLPKTKDVPCSTRS